eukprot:TRINITY_DN17580_c0_g1_i1.p1 TRINITY_DN17580_c0_g1~~TRINITY_DN17580_c0_g1_i1.p1  ORF type:complete len:268 (+),score=30.13 TRINITY_DN17580_c0_g1_i1:120-923(+)
MLILAAAMALHWPTFLLTSTLVMSSVTAVVPRAAGSQVHRCSVCGSTKHNITTCKLPGAKKLRALTKSTSKTKSSKVRNNRIRKSSKKSPVYAKKARQQYSGAAKPQRDCWSKNQVLKVAKEMHFPQDITAYPEAAFSWLVERGFLPFRMTCLKCRSSSVEPPHHDHHRSSNEGLWHQRCLSCGHYWSVYDGTCFAGFRQPMTTLVKCVLWYVQLPKFRLPLASALLAATAEMHYVGCRRFLDALRFIEGRAYDCWLKKGPRLSGLS